MSEHAETPERRHARYLRYAAEAHELAVRTTDSIREHHVRVAEGWEAMARKLASLLPKPKPNVLEPAGATLQGERDAANRVPPALGHRTEAVRGRLAGQLTRALGAPDAVAQDRQVESTEDPSS